MSVKLRPEEDNALNLPKKTEVISDELDIDRACRLLQDYTQQIRNQIQSIIPYTGYTIKYYSAAIIIFIALIYLLCDKIPFYNIRIQGVIWGSIGIFTSMIIENTYLSKKFKNVSYIRNLVDEFVEIINESHRIYERDNLTYWAKKELGIKLESAESALMEAREILKKSKPLPKNLNFFQVFDKNPLNNLTCECPRIGPEHFISDVAVNRRVATHL